MKRLTSEQKSALAAEYALGTLQGPARTAVQKRLLADPELRGEVNFWESQLGALAVQLPEREPDREVWRRIERALGFVVELPTPGSAPSRPREAEPPAAAGRPINPRFWPAWAGLATAAALVLAVLWLRPPAPADVAPQVAVVQNAAAEALWLIEIEGDSIRIEATAAVTAAQDADYELWLVAADGRAPVSLGLLPQSGEATRPRLALFDEVDVAALAVSREPLGGSPTGSPTEVLFTAQPLTLGTRS